MSDTDGAMGANTGGANTGGAQGGPGQGASFRIATQYVKDLSFESPNAPQSLGSGLPQPAIDIMVDVLPRRLTKEQFEVAIKLTAKATRGENVVFLAELLYAGLFSVSNVPEEHLQPLLLVEAPRFLFPFARRIMAEAVQDGGFPPLALDYMDFERIYRQQLAERANAGEGAAPQGEPGPSGDAPA